MLKSLKSVHVSKFKILITFQSTATEKAKLEQEKYSNEYKIQWKIEKKNAFIDFELISNIIRMKEGEHWNDLALYICCSEKIEENWKVKTDDGRGKWKNQDQCVKSFFVIGKLYCNKVVMEN